MTSFSDQIDGLATTLLLLNNKINREPVCLIKITSATDNLKIPLVQIYFVKKLIMLLLT